MASEKDNDRWIILKRTKMENNEEKDNYFNKTVVILGKAFVLENENVVSVPMKILMLSGKPDCFVLDNGCGWRWMYSFPLNIVWCDEWILKQPMWGIIIYSPWNEFDEWW